MENHHVTVERKSNGATALVVDGKDITNLARSVSIEMRDPSYPTEVRVELLPQEFVMSDEKARILIDEETSALLKRLGWTPPAEAA